jgi:hypothetical protein
MTQFNRALKFHQARSQRIKSVRKPHRALIAKFHRLASLFLTSANRTQFLIRTLCCDPLSMFGAFVINSFQK